MTSSPRDSELNEKSAALPYINEAKPANSDTQSHASHKGHGKPQYPVALDRIHLGFVERWYKHHRSWGFTLLAILSTAVSLILAFVLAQTLLLTDVDYTLENIDIAPRVSSY